MKKLYEKWAKHEKYDSSGASYMINVHNHFREDAEVRKNTLTL